MAPKVAVVTGSNKGIGFAIVRALCKQFEGDVFLTSRNEQLGQEAVKELQKEGLNPKYHQLDICNKESIGKLKQYLEASYGGVDVLVNNAAIYSQQLNEAEIVMRTNYTALVDVCDAIFPILKPGARVVHVSTTTSTHVIENVSHDLREKIKALNSIDEVTAMMNEFVASAKAGKHKELGWTDSVYGISKVGVTAGTPIQQATFDKDISRPDIIVNACCPGYVDTDMTNHQGHLTIDQGAETPVYLALLPAGAKSPKGQFLRMKKVYNWKAGEYPSFGV